MYFVKTREKFNVILGMAKAVDFFFENLPKNKPDRQKFYNRLAFDGKRSKNLEKVDFNHETAFKARGGVINADGQIVLTPSFYFH